MKKIEAIVPEDKMQAVFDVLKKLDLGGFTYFTVKGRGKRPREMVRSGSGRFESAYNANVNFFVVVQDNAVDKVVDMIVGQSSTGLAGEGKVFVYNVEDTIDVGSKLRGETSL